MTNNIICSMLESPYTSDNDEMDNGVSQINMIRTYNKTFNKINKS